ncbi:MAG: thioredoxin domain-containing protein [Verrucomicrobia bacterium]|nr:thioredoxin domain-containing protein [Verrucomicrobiota bacterium]
MEKRDAQGLCSEPAKGVCIVVKTACLIAFLISIYILYFGKGAHASLHGCGGETNCNEVIASRWAVLAGLPVAIYGAMGYGSVLLLFALEGTAMVRKYRVQLWSMITVMSLMGVGFITWLTLVQWLILEHFCPYCLSAHAFGAIAFLLLVWKSPAWKIVPRSSWRLSAPAVVGIAAMISVHVLTVPDTTLAESLYDLELQAAGTSAYNNGSVQLGKKKESRLISLLDGNITFDLYKMPVLGSREAPYVVLELFDYNCPACRRVYDKMEEFKRIHKGQVVVVPLPVPMESDCNPAIKRTHVLFKGSCEYARLAMAVCAVDSDFFPELHDWMMEGKYPPELQEVRTRALETLDEGALKKAETGEDVQKWMADGLNIYNFINGKSLPKLIAGDSVISSSGLAEKKMYRGLREALGIVDPRE